MKRSMIPMTLIGLALGLAAMMLPGCAIQPYATPPAATAAASAPASPAASAPAPQILALTPDEACSMWGNALKVGATIGMNKVQEQQVGILETQINPMCDFKPGAPPPTGTQIQAAIQKGLVNLAAIEAVTQAIKHSQ